MFRRIFFLIILSMTCGWTFSQSLSEIYLHFSEDELKVPMEVRHKMIYNKGNTLINYDGYSLKVYDKRAKFIQIITPLKHTYEIAVWKLNKKDILELLLREEYGTLPSAPHSVTATLQKNDAKFCAGKADLQGRYLRKVSECLAFDGFLSDFLWKTQKPSARRSFPSYRWLCSVFIFRSVRKKDSVISVCLSVCLKIIANLDIDVNPLFVYFFDFPKNIVSQLCE